MYKNGNATVNEELVSFWYRLNPKDACSSGNTTANTASQAQLVFEPEVVLEDGIFYSAILTKNASVSVSVGGVSAQGGWLSSPEGDVGIYHGSVELSLGRSDWRGHDQPQPRRPADHVYKGREHHEELQEWIHQLQCLGWRCHCA